MFKKFLRALNQHLEEYLIALFFNCNYIRYASSNCNAICISALLYLGRKNLALTVSFILPF